MASLDEVFGGDTVFLDRVTDAARVLSDRDRRVLDRRLGAFQRTFPQLFAAIYIGRLPRTASIRQFGFWLLNRAAVASVDYTRPNDRGVLFVLDVASESASISVGYFVESILGEEDLAEILRAGQSAMRRGLHARGLERSVARLSRVLRCRERESRRVEGAASPAAEADDGACSPGHGLEGIRDGHRMGPPPGADETEVGNEPAGERNRDHGHDVGQAG